MLELERTVRMFLNDDPVAPDAIRNGFAGWPPPRGLGRYLELFVRCRGEADPVTGYFINIKHIDEAVRDHALPRMHRYLAESPAHAVPMGSFMRDIRDVIDPPLNGTVVSLRLALSPFHSLTLESNDMNHVILRQRYEFSAAHRLHVDELSDDRNREIFGKCNNPAGHGHNYQVEVAVRAPIDKQGRTLLPEDLDALVDEAAIERLDHTHLNVDVEAFKDLNPSVENIAKVIYDWLHERVGELGLALDEVSVWETGKTRCVYRGEQQIV